MFEINDGFVKGGKRAFETRGEGESLVGTETETQKAESYEIAQEIMLQCGQTASRRTGTPLICLAFT